MTIRRFLDLLEDWFTGIILILGLGIMLIGVFARYVLNNPIFWGDEVGNYLVIWGALLGTGVALREGRHIRVSILYDHLPSHAQWWVSLFANLIGFGFCVFFIFGGITLVQMYLLVGQVSLNAQIPLWIPYLVAPITGVVFGKNFISELYDLLKIGRHNWKEEQERRSKDDVHNTSI